MLGTILNIYLFIFSVEAWDKYLLFTYINSLNAHDSFIKEVWYHYDIAYIKIRDWGTKVFNNLYDYDLF